MSETKRRLHELNSRPLETYPVFKKELDKPSPQIYLRSLGGGPPIPTYDYLNLAMSTIVALSLLGGTGIAKSIDNTGIYLALFAFLVYSLFLVFKGLFRLTESETQLGLEEKEVLVLSNSLEEKSIALDKLKEKRNEAIERSRESIINL